MGWLRAEKALPNRPTSLPNLPKGLGSSNPSRSLTSALLPNLPNLKGEINRKRGEVRDLESLQKRLGVGQVGPARQNPSPHGRFDKKRSGSCPTSKASGWAALRA